MEINRLRALIATREAIMDHFDELMTNYMLSMKVENGERFVELPYSATPRYLLESLLDNLEECING